MPSVAEQQLALLTAQGVALAQALKDSDDDAESSIYQLRAKVINKIFKQGMKELKKERSAKKVRTEHAKALDELDLLNKEYSKAYEFEDLAKAQAALRSLADEEGTRVPWVTGKSGRHGGNKTRQHHGGPFGCFMITTNKQTGIATLWVAGDNENDLPEDIEGACDIEEESEHDTGEHDADLGLLVACAGVSIADIKKMSDEEREAHAAKCAKEPNIKANDVLALAKKMKCPSEEGKVVLNTKAKRLVWMLQSFDTP